MLNVSSTYILHGYLTKELEGQLMIESKEPFKKISHKKSPKKGFSI
jgi:hypothetical protein